MGWAGLKWRLQRGLKNFTGLRRHFSFTLFANQLQNLECRAGFAFKTFFQEIKKLLFLNFLTAIFYGIYLAYPLIAESLAHYSQMSNLTEVTNGTVTTASDGTVIPVLEWQNVTQLLLNKRSFIFYSFDNATPKLILTMICVYYGLSLLSCFANTWGCVKVILRI